MKTHIFTASTLVAVFAVAIATSVQLQIWLEQHHVLAASDAGGYGQALVKFPSIDVQVKIPLTTDLEERGLAGVSSIADRRGMLWMYDTAKYYSFWMKGMLTSLDFIWIRNGQVVDITPSVEPPVGQSYVLPIYRPNAPANAILEVQAGFATEHGIRVGDTVKIDKF